MLICAVGVRSVFMLTKTGPEVRAIYAQGVATLIIALRSKGDLILKQRRLGGGGLVLEME